MSPTILYLRGWRLFTFANEGREPMHVHAVKGDAVCKFWLDPDSFDIEEAYAFNLTPALNREVRRIIFNNFEVIIQAWRAR
jgi:hypothetical protein